MKTEKQRGNVGIVANISDLADPNSRLLVMPKCCENCLYTRRRLVSADSAKRHMREARQKGHFICHKATYANIETVEVRANPLNVVCRGFYEANQGQTHFRLAAHIQAEAGLQMMYYVDLETGRLTPFGPNTEKENADGV